MGQGGGSALREHILRGTLLFPMARRMIRKDMGFSGSNDNGDSRLRADLRPDAIALETEEEFSCQTNSPAPTATVLVGAPGVTVAARLRRLGVGKPSRIYAGNGACRPSWEWSRCRGFLSQCKGGCLMDLPLGDRTAVFHPVRLNVLAYDLTDAFRRYQQYTVAESLEKPKYQNLADRVHAEYTSYLSWSVGEFLYALKRMEDSFYRSWLNPHGDAVYCTFKLADEEFLALRGLYAYTVDDRLAYIGRCRDSFGQRVNAGYGRIAPKNCYRDGQSTNCHLNALVNRHRQSMLFYVYPMENGDEIVAAESELITRFRPPWNVQLTVPRNTMRNPPGSGKRLENHGPVNQP